jgi:imidazolonepropionase-like amidohydrolase
MNRAFAGTILAVALAWPGAQAATLVHAGALIDGRADRAAGPATIVIEDGRITAVERGLRAPGPGDELIDLSGSTVLPGLMDMHTHVSKEQGPGSYMLRFTQGAAQIALQSTVYAHRTLQAGFTTIRDLGDSHNVSIALRDAIARGDVAGPRIFTSGKSIATTGGHADPTSGWAPHLAGDPGPTEGVVNGVADARKAVRQRYKDGADLIKVTATGGVLSLAASGENPQFAQDELDAIVATARDYGFHVAAHAHGAEGIKRAVRAGVHSIEHGTYLDDEAIQLMKQHGTWYVATIHAGRFVAAQAEVPGYFPEIVRPKAAAIGPLIQGDVRARPQGGRQDRLRHGLRRRAARRQCPRIRLHGRGWHVPHGCDTRRHLVGRRTARRPGPAWHGRARQSSPTSSRWTATRSPTSA